MKNSIRFFLPQASALILAVPLILLAQSSAPTELRIHADQVTAHVSPLLYGLMTEEINYSYDGGLYAELVRNRNFKEDAKQPVHWQMVAGHGAMGSISLDSGNPLNEANGVSLKLAAEKAAPNQPVGVANDGFWGIPVRPRTSYHASLWAKAAAGFTGPLNLAIVSNDGAVVHAKAQVPRLTTDWRKYEATLTTGDAPVSADNRLVISMTAPGVVWLNVVSLFPPTFDNRPNGNRQDIMKLLAAMKPAFLRFPGGNYLEGNTVATRFDWKKTIGDNSARPGHMDDAWRYWSSDGMGLLEFLEWCEDLHMEPVLGVYAGYSLRGGARFKPGPELEPYVQEALEEIEYVTGGPNTAWGARRAKDGHPAPFHLQYVEIGNEDNGDRETGSYEGRFAQFFDAIRAKFPELKIVATTSVTTRAADVIDEHYYRRSEDEMAFHANDYDTRRRLGGPLVFVGEWATRVGDPTPTLGAALGDAAWMIGMERNSDIVIMASYAPLFVNVNKGGMQWQTDLIGYDTLTSYGSPSYYAQTMFSNYHGDEVLATSAQSVPSREWQPPMPRGGRGPAPTTPQQTPMPLQAPLMFFDATRDGRSGVVYVKVVNRGSTAYPVHITVDGLAAIEPSGEAVVMKGDGPQDTNSITNPEKVKPVTIKADGLSKDFTHTFPPFSVTVLQMKGR
ncbi:MAG TPA: alpha-L-arabinofuranosidase C-terminal domain-containing protein [Bryobacteraceae bacterium]|nr:alpha-L-arabinofuranosidase C-terminal domain-containing protein [Bryobacteraceae bacterium]